MRGGVGHLRIVRHCRVAPVAGRPKRAGSAQGALISGVSLFLQISRLGREQSCLGERQVMRAVHGLPFTRYSGVAESLSHWAGERLRPAATETRGIRPLDAPPPKPLLINSTSRPSLKTRCLPSIIPRRRGHGDAADRFVGSGIDDEMSPVPPSMICRGHPWPGAIDTAQ